MSQFDQPQRRPPSPDRAPADEDLTLIGLLRFLVRHRRLVLGTGAAAFLLIGTIAFLGARTYSSTARFMPQASEGALSRLSGLAATFGVSVPLSDPGSSPTFYADLLQSRDILRRTVETQYAFAAPGDSMHGTLVQLLRIRGDSPAARRDAAAKRLLESINVTVGRETGTVDLEVTTPWAELSRQVATRMIELVSDFNLHRRQTKAGAERRFVEGRVTEAQDSLRAAEARFQRFLQRNREYRNSPQLQFEFDRLQRDVNMQQQVYTSLAQSYEAARIDEVRNTPVITLMEAPDLPAKPNARLALLKGMLAGLLGIALGAFFAAARQAFGGLFRAGGPARRGETTVASPAGGPAREPMVSSAAESEDS
jgi:uncharacterized protein involved in exopolysaccharide biosynthesis